MSSIYLGLVEDSNFHTSNKSLLSGFRRYNFDDRFNSFDDVLFNDTFDIINHQYMCHKLYSILDIYFIINRGDSAFK